MIIKHSKNLKYDKIPGALLNGFERFNPRLCFLDSFSRIDDKLTLFFKNKSQTTIRAIKNEGGREVDLIENQLIKFIGKSYEEILNIEIS